MSAPPPGQPAAEPVPKPGESAERTGQRQHGSRTTWLGVVVPASLLLVQIQVNYALVPWACASGHAWVIHLVSLACLAGALAGTAVSGQAWTLLGGGGSSPDATTLSSARFVALGALVFSASIALVIVAVDLPAFVLGPCD